MGVPGFFAWLLKKYKKNNIITSNLQIDIDAFYIDANCLFHPQCHKVLEYYADTLDIIKLENKMIQRIINFIDYIIAFVNPKNKVFISVDGVAPLAKINQQRKRRYKAYNENMKRNEIKKKHNKKIVDIWSNAAITPGTIFMEKLHLKIIEHLNKISKSESNKNITYIYSSYHTPGEGEHKILDDIKQLNNNTNIVVYGLDADLMFLAMASSKPNIYLLREEISASKSLTEPDDLIDILTDVAEQLEYVSVDLTKQHISTYLNEHIKKSLSININIDIYIDESNILNDFIIICFFLGNDFIPNLPSINIKANGLDNLLDAYIRTYVELNTYFVIDNKISNKFLIIFLKHISNNECDYWTTEYVTYQHRLLHYKPKTSDPYQIEIWKMENIRDIDLNTINSAIKLGVGQSSDWKYRYYDYYNYDDNNIKDKIIIEYLRGIAWTFKYYFNGSKNYSWQYLYNCAPFASDIVNYINMIDNDNFDINMLIETVNTIDTLVTPFAQLLAVVPPQYSNLLPSKLSNFMTDHKSPIIDIFPTHVKIDYAYRDVLHKCIPLISNVDINRIIKAINKIKYSDEEKKLNAIENNYIYNYVRKS